VVTPIRKNDLADKVIEELRQQLAVTEAVLLKVLEKHGTTTLTAEELAAPVGDNVVIDMDFDEKTEVWTFSLKDEEPQEL
jgi:RNA-binding protein YhbY